MNLSRFKPGGLRKTHLLLAALLWSAIGTILLLRGMHWLAQDGDLVLLIPALLLGTLKSKFILDKTAQKSIKRISDLADGTCLGAVYSKTTWALVLFMMGMGVMLRMSPCPRYVLGVLYAMIGTALLRSSRLGWRAWKN